MNKINKIKSTTTSRMEKTGKNNQLNKRKKKGGMRKSIIKAGIKVTGWEGEGDKSIKETLYR